jgi:hypothetical protein
MNLFKSISYFLYNDLLVKSFIFHFNNNDDSKIIYDE